MRTIFAALCAVSLCSCATTLKPVYVAPDDVTVEGEGLSYPNESARNVVAFSSGLPFGERVLTLNCPDGRTETVSLQNDGIDPLGLISSAVLVVLSVSNVVSAARSADVIDQVYYGVVAGLTGGVAGLTFLTSWQPSRPVRVNHPGSVCARSVEPPPTTTPTTTPSEPPALVEPEVAPEVESPPTDSP